MDCRSLVPRASSDKPSTGGRSQSDRTKLRSSRLVRWAALLSLSAVVLTSASLVQLSSAQDAAAPAEQGKLQPTGRDSLVAKIIAKLMPINHISGEPLNDKISNRAFKLYVETLDPLKLYFFQSDIEEFQRRAANIDDMVQEGDLNLAYDIFRRFTRRVDERVTTALELLDGEFDFKRDEEIAIDPEAASYAKTPEEAKDRWRRQIKYALLDLKDDETVGNEAKDQLRRRYQRYARRWKQTDSDDLLEMYLTALTMSYDPHSTYMSPSTLEDFSISMKLNLEGIGAALKEDDGNTVVSSVIPGGAAAKHGLLKPDDVIVSVGQDQEGEMLDIVEMPLKEVVKLIRGKAGSTVRLGVKPGGVGNVEVYTIVRARVELEEQAARGKVIDHELPGSAGPLKIGYINLPSFYLDMEGARRKDENYRSSTRDVANILEDFKSKSVDGVVLDLSRNGGGSLTEAISLTGLFIDRGPVVQVKSSDGSVSQYPDDDGGAVAWNGPLVVMTTKLSASASEIFAGAIKDYGRGIVVGDPATHGKGSVQTLMDLAQQIFRNRNSNYGALKVTLQQFYLPDGESTQLEGVKADVVLPSITSRMDIAEGDLKFALEHDRVPAAKHTRYNMAPARILDSLRKSSRERVAENEEFSDLLRRMELYTNQKERAVVSLNEEKFMKRRAELDARQEEEKEELASQEPSEEIFDDTFYNQEVLNIAHEYVRALRQRDLAYLK